MRARLKLLAERLWHSPTFTSWGSLAVRLSSVVLVLPFVLVRFSPAEVSVWQLFATLFMLMLLFDFGLSPTISRMLAFARGGASLADMADMRRPSAGPRVAETKTAATVFSAVRWLYPRFAIAITLLFALLGTIALQHPIAHTANPGAAWGAWGLVLLSSAVGFWGNCYSAALQGMDSIAPLRRWEVATGLAQICTSVGVLAGGGGLFWLVATYQFWVVFNAVRNRMLLKRLHPALFDRPATRDPEALRTMWPATWRSGIGVLMSHGIVQGSGVAYSQFGEPAQVAAYLLALRVITMISQFSQAPFYSKLPRLAQLQAAGERDALCSLAQQGMRWSHWVFVCGALGVALFAQPALDFIGSRTPFVPPLVWALMSLGIFMERYGGMHLQLYSLTNHIVWHIANGISGLLMIGIAVVSYSTLREYAFPLAMLLAYAGFYSVYSVRRSCSALGLSFRTFESRASLAAITVLCTGLGACLLFRPA